MQLGRLSACLYLCSSVPLAHLTHLLKLLESQPPVGLAREQGLQGVPRIFNPPVQGCQAMLLIGSCTASYWPSLLEANVPVLGVIRREFVAMEVFTDLFAVCSLATDRASTLALRFSPTKHIPQPGIQLLNGKRDMM